MTGAAGAGQARPLDRGCCGAAASRHWRLQGRERIHHLGSGLICGYVVFDRSHSLSTLKGCYAETHTKTKIQILEQEEKQKTFKTSDGRFDNWLQRTETFLEIVYFTSQFFFFIDELL